MTPGTLYIVATPIGNLDDITLRALRVLREADLIACEDTRYSARLLAHYGITTPRESYHDHNERERTPRFLERLHRGQNIALISDSGTPLISDPGYALVSACRNEGIPVVPIPGPSAVIAALAGCGLPMGRFYFVGFLPPRSQARKAELEKLRAIDATLVFYEAPHRIRESLLDVREILGDRRAAVARELTKLHEQFIRGAVSEIIAHFEANEPRGEMTLVIAGSREDNLGAVQSISVSEEVERLERERGLSRIDAIKQAARSRGLSKREAYQLLLDEKESNNDESIG